MMRPSQHVARLESRGLTRQRSDAFESTSRLQPQSQTARKPPPPELLLYAVSQIFACSRPSCPGVPEQVDYSSAGEHPSRTIRQSYIDAVAPSEEPLELSHRYLRSTDA